MIFYGNKDSLNNLKEIFNNFTSNSENQNNNKQENDISSENTSSKDNSSNENSSFPDIDIGTILKMKTIFDKMNSSKDDPRSNLLLSLKPYLKESRKNKLDQYVKLLNMEKVIKVINPLGGGKTL